jgi:hypothetical protein
VLLDVEERGAGVEAHAEDAVEADAEERTPTGMWRKNNRVRV